MEIYDVPQLNRMLKTTKATLRLYLATGRIKGKKIGGHWVTCDETLKAFLMSNTNTRRNTVTDKESGVAGDSVANWSKRGTGYR